MSRTEPGPPPEAVLIRRAREALGISPETAARRIRVKLSGRRWRQLEAGEEGPDGPRATMSDGQLAHMAAVVRLRPDHLDEIGKVEAAAILRTIGEIGNPPAENPRPIDMLRELRARIDRIMADPERRDMLDKFTRSIDPGEHTSQAG